MGLNIQREPALRTSGGQAGLCILVVDHEPLVRRVLGRVLEPHEVTFAADYDDAIQHMLDGTFDAIVTDFELPGPSGFDVLGAATMLQPGAPGGLDTAA